MRGKFGALVVLGPKVDASPALGKSRAPVCVCIYIFACVNI